MLWGGRNLVLTHDDVIKWRHFPCYWPFVWGIHRSPVNSPHKDQWRGALMFSLICVWINGWVNNREAGDLRRHRAHYDVIVMLQTKAVTGFSFTIEWLWHEDMSARSMYQKQGQVIASHNICDVITCPCIGRVIGEVSVQVCLNRPLPRTKVTKDKKEPNPTTSTSVHIAGIPSGHYCWK